MQLAETRSILFATMFPNVESISFRIKCYFVFVSRFQIRAAPLILGHLTLVRLMHSLFLIWSTPRLVGKCARARQSKQYIFFATFLHNSFSTVRLAPFSFILCARHARFVHSNSRSRDLTRLAYCSNTFRIIDPFYVQSRDNNFNNDLQLEKSNEIVIDRRQSKSWGID